MRVVAFNGSPRVNGNTAFLLKTALDELREAGWECDYVQVGGASVHGCRACYACFKNANGRCVFNDDPVNEWIEKASKADAILMGSPTYFANVSMEMKALIDRLGLASYSVDKKLLAGKVGAAVVCHRRGGAIQVFDSINHFFLALGMIVPGSSYWNFGVGRLPGEVSEDKEAVENIRHIAKSIDWLGRIIKASPTPFPVPPTFS